MEFSSGNGRYRRRLSCSKRHECSLAAKCIRAVASEAELSGRRWRWRRRPSDVKTAPDIRNGKKLPHGSTHTPGGALSCPLWLIKVEGPMSYALPLYASPLYARAELGRREAGALVASHVVLTEGHSQGNYTHRFLVPGP